MAFRSLKSFFPAADDLLRQNLETLGPILLKHLKSYEGLNTVYQHAGLNRSYFRAMLENRNVGLGPVPKEPEFGVRQPEVTKRMMEAWNWLERQGLLIRNDEQVADWFLISTEGEKLLESSERALGGHREAAVSRKSASDSFLWEDIDNRLLSPRLQELSDEMHTRTVEGERKAAADTRESGNAAGFLSRLFDFQERLTDEWTQRVYKIHCEVWAQQNRSVTGEFIRAVRDRAVLPLIAARKSTVQCNVALRGTRIGETPNGVSVGEWNRRMDRLATRWSQRLEADAVSEEYRASRPPDGIDDRRFALLAIEEARNSVPEDDGEPHPYVGAVVVKDGNILATAHRGETGKGRHAEFCALKKINDDVDRVDLSGCTVYTTLEPCSQRNSSKTACATRLINAKVARVVYGMADKDESVYGHVSLAEANIDIGLFPRDLIQELIVLNKRWSDTRRKSEPAPPPNDTSPLADVSYYKPGTSMADNIRLYVRPPKNEGGFFTIEDGAKTVLAWGRTLQDIAVKWHQIDDQRVIVEGLQRQGSGSSHRLLNLL